ncbi:MAG: hypothetical protein HYT07_02180 [Candidatus Levybacteria bacterium]|nr:hypothetical protein [Candidatus Levybacteria bacterium]
MLYKKYLFLWLIILISFITITDLFRPGLPVTHDGQDHVARIANFYQNLTEGNIIPRWAGNLNWGYGHPILEFLYPLPSYFASIFHFLGFTLVDSLKLVFGVSFVLSGVTMYVFIRELLRDEKAAFLAGLLYVIAPYRFVDLYVRGAIGEHVAFIFPPLIFYFLLKLSKRYSWWYLMGGAISFAGLNLAHNAISLMFILLFGLFALFLLLQSKKKIQLGSQYLATILLGFGLSAFFWLPAFIEGKYTLRDIVTGGGEYARSFVAWKDFFFGQWSYGGTLTLSKQIGIVHWIGTFSSVIAIYYLYRNKNKLWILGLGSFLIFWIALFLMTSASAPIWQSVTVLQKFQFPWRFLSLTVFVSALLGAIASYALPDKYKKILLLIFVLSLLLANKDYWHANGYLHKPESFYNVIYDSTTDTGESSPIWSIRFMEKRPKAHIEVISGEAVIKELNRESTLHAYEIDAAEKSRIVENTLYFPGWNVFLEGKETKIEFQDPQNRGLITFFLEKGKHEVVIRFKETKVRLLANILSIISLFLIIILSILNKSSIWRRFR